MLRATYLVIQHCTRQHQQQHLGPTCEAVLCWGEEQQLERRQNCVPGKLFKQQPKKPVIFVIQSSMFPQIHGQWTFYILFYIQILFYTKRKPVEETQPDQKCKIQWFFITPKLCKEFQLMDVNFDKNPRKL